MASPLPTPRGNSRPSTGAGAGNPVTFTPGPWLVPSASFPDDGADDEVAYHIRADGMCMSAANARLIAAAPDLLEALRRALPQLQFERDCWVESHTMPFMDMSTLDPDIKPEIDALDATLEVMRAAISKALGESTHD